MSFDLAQVEANGGWMIQIEPHTPVVTPVQLEYGEITVDANQWSVIHGMPQYDRQQAVLIEALSSVHVDYDPRADNDYVWLTESGPSDPMTVREVSPYGSPYRTANPRPFPGSP